MRATYAVVAAATVAVVSAATSMHSDLTTYYKTEYYTDCSNVTSGVATATGTVVQTHCPHCTEGGSNGGSVPAPGPMTTYTTVYKEFCSTAPDHFSTKTYTVTESCSSPGAPRPSDYVPSGFVVTTATCHVCAETPVVATLTTPTPQAPSPAPAANGAPAPAPATPTGSRSSPAAPPSAGSPGSDAPAAPAAPNGGAPPSPSSAGSSSGQPAGDQPAAGQPAADQPAAGQSGTGQSGTGPAAGPAAGPDAKAPVQPGGAGSYQPAGDAPASPGSTGASGASGPSNSSIMPFTGTASSLSLSTVFTSVMMAAVGVLAFAL
ncbi:MAG: hypothetical protein Q9216_005701 [Gyalolechia sp. 2 TL-2023]